MRKSVYSKRKESGMSIRTMNYVAGATLMFIALLYSAAFGQHSHDHSGGSAPVQSEGLSSASSIMNRSVQSVIVKGVKITLDVMAMDTHMQMQGLKKPGPGPVDQIPGHVIVVRLEDAASKKTIKYADVSIALTEPDGKRTRSRVTGSSGHYGLRFSPAKNVIYEIQVDVDWKGERREASFKFEAK
jgi:hypothetical protein